MRQIDTLINLGVAGTVIAATELTIEWNAIEDINDITSAGQTIPLVIGIGLIIRVVYIYLFPEDKPGDQNDRRDGSRRRRSKHRGPRSMSPVPTSGRRRHKSYGITRLPD